MVDLRLKKNESEQKKQRAKMKLKNGSVLYQQNEIAPDGKMMESTMLLGSNDPDMSIILKSTACRD